MKRIILLILLGVAIGQENQWASAQSADDEYIRILSLIDKADSLGTNQAGQAIAKYREAEIALKTFQQINPAWNTKLVNVRIGYLAERIADPALNPLQAKQALEAMVRGEGTGADWIRADKRVKELFAQSLAEAFKKNGMAKRLGADVFASMGFFYSGLEEACKPDKPDVLAMKLTDLVVKLVSQELHRRESLASRAASTDLLDITFTNRIVTFTNLYFRVYRNVELVRADSYGLIYSLTDGVGGGRVLYTNLSAECLEALGISANRIALAKAQAQREADLRDSYAAQQSPWSISSQAGAVLQDIDSTMDPRKPKTADQWETFLRNRSMSSVKVMLGPPEWSNGDGYIWTYRGLQFNPITERLESLSIRFTYDGVFHDAHCVSE